MAFYIERYHDLERKEYEIEVVTPMFLGGADPKKAEIRGPSLKGMLRFWWRALNSNTNIPGLYNKESDIFGDTDSKSKISLKVESVGIKPSLDMFKGKKFTAKSQGREFNLDILQYLAYGATEYKKGQGTLLIKEYIPPQSKFILSIQMPKSSLEEVDRALKYLVSFGGLGAKSRNGFGSLYCKDIPYLDSIMKKGSLASYSALSSQAQMIKFPAQNKWEDALSDIGLAYKDARLSLEQRHTFTKRALISKPIEVKGEKNIPKYVKENRHAKPYFLHVNRLDNGKYQGQILFIPYDFHPSDKSENLKSYQDACLKMNHEIEKKAGGNKWQ